jgi:hypothetical protein
LREPLLADKKPRFKTCDLRAVTWVGPATFAVFDEKYHRSSRLRHASSKSCCFGFGFCYRRTYDFLDERDPSFVALAVTSTAKGYFLLDQNASTARDAPLSGEARRLVTLDGDFAPIDR